MKTHGRWYDTHSSPIPADAVDLLSRLLPAMPQCATIVVERDGRSAESIKVAEDLRRVHDVVESTSHPMPEPR